MEPAQTPFPPPTNFPFQPESGIQTSKRISESGVGWMVPATRQNAGSAAKFAGGPPGTPPAPEGLKVPAGTSATSVIVVWGIFRLCESALQEGSACTGSAVKQTASSS